MSSDDKIKKKKERGVWKGKDISDRDRLWLETGNGTTHCKLSINSQGHTMLQIRN